jgi:hypothetical protein
MPVCPYKDPRQIAAEYLKASAPFLPALYLSNTFFFGLSNRNLIHFQDVFRQDCDAQHGLQDPVCLLDRAAEC